ncbi:DUF2972 domain-containing protein [Campylobacter lari]|nr:DUF2972 domain-containing protein [Campylobacter lari]EGK8029973.1 DUF2972 domain-containing protein [Campylobacter lari]
MYNPNSAIDRIKNSLSYKLGFTILEQTKQHRGYITLPYKLYKIKQQHFKEQKLYKQTIKIFPQIAHPKIESCKDYNEGIKYKYHLSYMLGETLIKAHKTWYKGGYLKLPSLLKEKYKMYKNIQDIISILPQKLHYHFYNSTIKNHKINIQNLIYILKQHKDYKPILENIFHNFDFFIKHFDLINVWLLSNDFKEKYEQENHPYPSLLDPKKLNDENEKINYKNIPAELAWEMNLPLPDNYKFACLSFGLAGHLALDLYLRRCSCTFVYANIEFLQSIYSKNTNRVLFISSLWKRNLSFQSKITYLLNIQCPILILVRDPIERLKTGVNHGYFAKSSQKNYDRFYMSDDANLVLERFKYHYKGKVNNLPFLENIDTYLENSVFELNIFVQNIRNKIIYIDMIDIMPHNAFDTMRNLSNIFDFAIPKVEDKKYFTEIKYNEFQYRLPLIMNISYFSHKIQLYIESRMSNDDKIDIFDLVFGVDHEMYNKIYFYVPKCHFELVNDEFINYIKKYLEDFLVVLREKVEFDLKNKKTEKDILAYMREKKELRVKLKKLLDKELVHIKQYRPDIVASWKYYQEFEKMCKELDGN